MKHQIHQFLLLNCLLLISLSGCKKDVDVFIPHTIIDPPILIEGNINAFFEDVQPESQWFSINNDEDNFVWTETRTRLHCTANLFVTTDDKAVNGVIDIEVIEAYNRGNMIRTNRPTMSIDGRLLISGGALEVKAFQDGQALKLADGLLMQVDLPATNPNIRTELFYGSSIDLNLPGIEPQFIWEEADGNPNIWENVSIGEWPDSLGSDNWNYGYQFETNSIDWFNCAAFYDDSNVELTSVCINLPNEYDGTNAAIFASFDDINAVLPILPQADVTSFCKDQIPIGERVNFVVIAERGTGIYYFNSKMMTVSANMEIDLIPELTEIDTINEFLDNL